jgi:hypothetical protein
VLSSGLAPKRFAGLFSAAPAVALASLTITLLDKTPHDAHQASTGMIAGSAGMVLYAAAAVFLLRRTRASRAALAALGGWALGAGVIAIPVLVG